MRDDDWSEPMEPDPRWEVQPELSDDTASGSRVRELVIVLLAIAILVAAVAWFLAGTP